jgi:hypothetical protein
VNLLAKGGKLDRLRRARPLRRYEHDPDERRSFFGLVHYRKKRPDAAPILGIFRENPAVRLHFRQILVILRDIEAENRAETG